MTILDPPIIPDLPIYRLSVDQYHEIIRSGALGEDDRVELIHGWMVPKVSNNPLHSVATELVVAALRAAIPADFSVRSEKPVTLSDSEPEPDAAVVKGTPRDYATRHPIPSDIEIVVEVADSSLTQNRKTKLQVYAAAKIACYWIVDLVNRRVEVHTKPKDARYSLREIFTTHVPVCVGGKTLGKIAVADILP